ncbi:MAG TPA: glycoside hydrolase family 3 N-terminal domain-containing protein, partial [Tepidiformaceae bacterium]|nr:glycoside hydrolase family 3 N-terminal domain-containing protein [Tepidiformaceae bacterium]
MPNTETDQRIDALLAQMTLEEKISLAAGSDAWHTTPVSRVGVPRIKVTDGPNGARGSNFIGTTSACFPCGTALGATWDPELVRLVGAAIGREARSKQARVLLAPTMNIHRHPLAGRNFECPSEDPFLTARIVVGYIEGVQSQRVAATAKHFVCNDSEFERMTISSEVSERALREIYLPPFEAAVKEAGTWAVMSSYNRINGTHACNNADLLTTILKDEWGFDGLVMSDWWGTRSTIRAANAGLDLEMPGPGHHFGARLNESVASGQVSGAV